MATLRVIWQSWNYPSNFGRREERWLPAFDEIKAKKDVTEDEESARQRIPYLVVTELECWNALYQAVLKENVARENRNIGAQQLTMGYDQQKPGSNAALTGQSMGLSMRLKVEKTNRLKALRDYIQVVNDIQKVIEKFGYTWEK